MIDGFIAYGVRALLVLRTASFAARLYVWTLFGTATAASIWANALHAVRLNQQHPEGGGLRLGDVTVGALSTIAPLALAGAVHLYILIARRVAEPGHHGHSDAFGVRADRIAADRPETRRAEDGHRPVPVTSGQPAALSGLESGRPAVTSGPDVPRAAAREELSGHPESAPESEPAHGGDAADLGGQSVSRPVPVTRLRLAAPRSPSRRPARTLPRRRRTTAARTPPRRRTPSCRSPARRSPTRARSPARSSRRPSADRAKPWPMTG